MKCPFKKKIYVHNTTFFEGYPQEQEITESFGECDGEKCAVWSGVDCGLRQPRTIEDLPNYLTLLNSQNS
jgi:hypothetical protein